MNSIIITSSLSLTVLNALINKKWYDISFKVNKWPYGALFAFLRLSEMYLFSVLFANQVISSL